MGCSTRQAIMYLCVRLLEQQANTIRLGQGTAGLGALRQGHCKLRTTKQPGSPCCAQCIASCTAQPSPLIRVEQHRKLSGPSLVLPGRSPLLTQSLLVQVVH